MYIKLEHFSSILGVDKLKLEIDFISRGIDIIQNSDESSSIFMADAIRYVHADSSIIQKVENYHPKDAYMESLQNCLLCRCPL